METRFNFTYNFLIGAASLAKNAKAIESKVGELTDEEKQMHMAYVAGSIMQTVAAIESEVWNILNHGPGYHLGSDGTNIKSKELLQKIAQAVERNEALDKYQMILSLADCEQLKVGQNPYQDTKLIIRLRNEITHYKSRSTSELDSIKLFETLKSKNNTPPSFYINKNHNFFPHVCLSYERAKWSLNTSVNFINHFYSLLKIDSPLVRNDISKITLE